MVSCRFFLIPYFILMSLVLAQFQGIGFAAALNNSPALGYNCTFGAVELKTLGSTENVDKFNKNQFRSMADNRKELSSNLESGSDQILASGKFYRLVVPSESQEVSSEENQDEKTNISNDTSDINTKEKLEENSHTEKETNKNKNNNSTESVNNEDNTDTNDTSNVDGKKDSNQQDQNGKGNGEQSGIAGEKNTGKIFYLYDCLNRRTEKHYPDGTVVYYSYDESGNLTSVITEPCQPK
ncbi:MAG: RHS repeat domain-containing protein [Desulfobacterales bacterium]